MGWPILEREHELAVLAAAAREAAGGAGSAVLVSGEAGIGKSSLVDGVRAHLPAEGRMLVGYCDDLATPRTLGPFRDLVGKVGTELARAIQQGSDRDRVLAAVRAELDWPGRPTVLVVEDVHWADEATLDVLRFLVRRIAGLPAVLVLTYRDDELAREHPLHDLLGRAAGAARVHRLPLRRLSPEAVRKLSAGRVTDGDRVFSVTSGNPFFVSEILASGGDDPVPPTVVDAVLSRVRGLDPSIQDVLEQLAVVPSAVDRWLLDGLVPGSMAALAEAERRGLLAVTPLRVAFGHELARRAVADSIPAARRMELNRRVLAVLVGRDGADLSLIVHHAAEAGDEDTIARYAPRAAEEAARAGAHREAAAHYRLVLGLRSRFPAAEQADLLERYAIECSTVGAAPEALAAQRDAVALRRDLGEPRALGADLRWLSRMYWVEGERPAAERAGAEATAVLETAGDPRLLAYALSNQSQLAMLACRGEESIRLGERAAALAREVGDAEVLSHALTNIGSVRWTTGDPGGEAVLAEALRVALDAGETEHALRAYVGIGWNLLDQYRLDEAERVVAAGIELAERAEYLTFASYLSMERARLEFGRAQWSAAVRTAEPVTREYPPARCPALTVLGRVRVRLGQPGGDELLAQAWELAVSMEELQRVGPVAIARAESAWLRGDLAAVGTIAGPVYEQARQLGGVGYTAELGYWLVRAGQLEPPGTGDHPYAIQAAGRWQEAAQAWRAAGCRYEYAVALAESPDPADLLAALAELEELGAEPMTRIVRSRLRERGVARLPRGPRPATRDNPAGLTGRQLAVLQLLGTGMTNAEIAERLVLSVRTVDTHVAAVLGKLGAGNRREAVARAAELGVLETRS